MSCIPTSRWQKHFLRAKYWCHAIGVTEKPNCSSFEKIIKTTLSAIDDVVKIVTGAVGGIFATAVVDYAFDTLEGYIKIDIRNLEKYAGAVGTEWDKLEWLDRHHIYRMGFADIAHAYNTFLQQLQSGTLPKPILNWIYFIKGLDYAWQNGMLQHWRPHPDNIKVSIEEVHKDEYGLDNKYTRDFIKYSQQACEIILDLKAEDYEKKADGTPDYTKLKKFNLGKAAIPLAALLFTFKK